MTPASLGIGAVILAILVGFTLTIGAPWPAIPIVLVAIAIGAMLWFRSRGSRAEMLEHRKQAGESEVEFTARDRETLVP